VTERTLTRLVEALAAGDRPALTGLLAAEVRLRALLPSRSVDRTGAAEVAEEMLGWFAEVPEIVPLSRSVDTVAGLWHLAYRFALRGTGPEEVVEQHAYCTVPDGTITAIRLVCSGFRPVAPEAARRLDALGEGCATLTPRIAAALRGMAPGEVLAVLADDPAAREGLAAWSRLTGHGLVATADEPAGIRYYLRHA
jgi:TusA-related sulfurtransferase